MKRVLVCFCGIQISNWFAQAIFDSLPPAELAGATLLVSGDGRYHNREAANLIVRMCAANGVRKVLCARNFLLATPACSATIRARKALGGIVLTASHNPGGPNADFGIKCADLVSILCI